MSYIFTDPTPIVITDVDACTSVLELFQYSVSY